MGRDMSGLRAVYTVCIYTCFVVLAGTGTARLARGEVHCYCNSPMCSSSNYMCESQLGCYSELVDRGGSSNDPYLHGCIESVSPDRCSPGRTSTADNNGTTAGPGDSETVRPPNAEQFSCCYESMCNFKDRSKEDAEARGPQDELEDQYTQPYEAVSDQAVWFRAAVIAVPIAGACILIGLIMVAAKMLRNEDKQFSKLSVNVRQRALLRHHQPNHHHHHHHHHNAAARNTTVHREPQFLANSRVKNINITGNKLVDPFVGSPQHHLHQQQQHHHNKINNMNNVTKVTNELLHQQRCVNECPRLIPTQHYEKMYRENFDVV